VDGSDFDDLLTGELSASVRWQPGVPCPCVDARGAADRSCPLCFGLGIVYQGLSVPFRCGLVSQTAKVRMAMQQFMGPGMVGDSVLVVPYSAPCYQDIRDGDRIWDQRTEDRYRIILTPGTHRTLPFGYRDLTAQIRSSDHTQLLDVPPPVLQDLRIAEVAVTTTLSFRAPRGYQVVADLSQVRSFGEGLPRKLSLNLLDASLRSPRAAQTIER
jgi:hypothetical protein